MPKPVLQALVLADHVYQDRQTGKFIIVGTFSRLIVGPANPAVQKNPDGTVSQQFTGNTFMRSGTPYVYLALVDVRGEVPLQLKFVDLEDANSLIDLQFQVTAVDPLSVAEYVVPFPALPVHKAGNYSLDLMHAGEILGSWRVTVVKADEVNPST